MIKRVNSVSRGYEKDRSMDVTSKIKLSNLLPNPEYSFYTEYSNLNFNAPIPCKIQVFCYWDSSCIIKFPNGDKFLVFNRDMDDTIKELVDLIKNYLHKNSVQEGKKMIRRSRKLESAYNSALNEVRYDVEHKFSPVDLKNGYYIGIDDVQYDYDELSATVFVLNEKDKIVDQESVSMEVDTMSDYTTSEIRDMTDLMLEKINTVVNSFKRDYGVNESRNRRDEDFDVEIDLFMRQHSELERSLKKAVNDLGNMRSTYDDLSGVLPEDVGRKLEDIFSELAGLERRVREIRY